MQTALQSVVVQRKNIFCSTSPPPGCAAPSPRPPAHPPPSSAVSGTGALTTPGQSSAEGASAMITLFPVTSAYTGAARCLVTTIAYLATWCAGRLPVPGAAQ
jgi:hypothetical protein